MASTTSTGGTGGLGGSGGVGGGPVVMCNGVVAAEPILTVDEPNGDLSQPSLVLLDTVPLTAAVVFARQSLPPIGGPTARVGAFDGWGAWPPAAPAIVDIKKQQGPGLVPAIALLAATRRDPGVAAFALLYEQFGAIATNIAPKVGANGLSGWAAESVGGTPLMLVQSPSVKEFLGAISAPSGNSFGLNMMVAAPSADFNFFTIGCASTPIVADAAGTADGWILVTSLGTPFGWNGIGTTCAQKFANIGPASTLDLVHVGPEGQEPTLTQTIETAAPISRIRLATRDEGAWLVWSLTGASDLSGGVLSSLPSLASTFQILAQVGTLDVSSFDVEPFGDTLVVAAVVQVIGADDQIQIVAIDTNGSPKWSALFATEGTVEGPLSLLAAPDGSTLLVAWSELQPGLMSRRLRIARLDCLREP